MVLISLGLNLFCAFVFVLAFAIAGEEQEVTESPPAAVGAIPPGFEWARQGPLYFARVRADSPAAPILGQSVFIAQDGCFVAGFEFTNGTARIESAELYDSDCLAKLDLNVSSGATIFTSYAKDGRAEYSLRDCDGDGVPDIRTEWDVPRSFKRAGELTWVPMSDDNAVDQRSHGSPPPSP